jgi:hypothetical protein
MWIQSTVQMFIWYLGRKRLCELYVRGKKNHKEFDYINVNTITKKIKIHQKVGKVFATNMTLIILKTKLLIKQKKQR